MTARSASSSAAAAVSTSTSGANIRSPRSASCFTFVARAHALDAARVSVAPERTPRPPGTSGRPPPPTTRGRTRSAQIFTLNSQRMSSEPTAAAAATTLNSGIGASWCSHRCQHLGSARRTATPWCLPAARGAAPGVLPQRLGGVRPLLPPPPPWRLPRVDGEIVGSGGGIGTRAGGGAPPLQPLRRGVTAPCASLADIHRVHDLVGVVALDANDEGAALLARPRDDQVRLRIEDAGLERELGRRLGERHTR